MTGLGIYRCWYAVTSAIGKCMGLDDDAYAVEDQVLHESIETQLLKQGLRDAHHDNEERK